jgi:plastocyanin
MVTALALGAGCAAPTAGLKGSLQASFNRRPRTSLENTVVYLVSDKPEPAVSGPPVTLEVGEGGLRPTVLAVSAGTRVEFRNRDSVFHMPFSISPADSFQTGPLSPGDKHSVLFEHPGVIHVFCELHPQESGYVYVVPTPRFTRADAHGHFRFTGLAPGNYTLRTWHPEHGETSQAVVVPRHGELQVTVAD